MSCSEALTKSDCLTFLKMWCIVGLVVDTRKAHRDIFPLVLEFLPEEVLLARADALPSPLAVIPMDAELVVAAVAESHDLGRGAGRGRSRARGQAARRGGRGRQARGRRPGRRGLAVGRGTQVEGEVDEDTSSEAELSLHSVPSAETSASSTTTTTSDSSS